MSPQSDRASYRAALERARVTDDWGLAERATRAAAWRYLFASIAALAHRVRLGTTARWWRLGMLAGLLLASQAQPVAAREPHPEPLEEIEFFAAGGASGILTLPAGAPDRRTPAVVILQDAQGSDGRAGLYTDQLLGAGFAVVEIREMESDSLGAVLDALAVHPRVAGQPVGLLGFGFGARLAAQIGGQVAARALLYPGCNELAPAVMRGEAVLLMHGTADAANEPATCANLGRTMAAAGAEVQVRVYPLATYAWDRPAFGGEFHSLLPRPFGPGRVNSEAWPELAALSASQVAGFFTSNLLGRRP